MPGYRKPENEETEKKSLKSRTDPKCPYHLSGTEKIYRDRQEIHLKAKEYDFSACWHTTKGVSSLIASFIKRYGEKNPSAEKVKK